MDGFEGSMAAQWTVLADLQSEGLIADLGLSNASAADIEELQQIAPVDDADLAIRDKLG